MNKKSMKENIDYFIKQFSLGQSIDINAYINYFNGLNVTPSFGKGNLSYIPFIAFLGDGQKTQKGIYPVILFYRNHDIIILSYGISSTNKPDLSWNKNKSQTIGNYFKEKKISLHNKEKRYNDSLIFKTYKLSDFSKDELIDDLAVILDEYKRMLVGLGKKESVEFEKPPLSKNVKREEFDISEYKGFLSESPEGPTIVTEPSSSNKDIVKTFQDALEKSNLIFNHEMIIRFVTSLATKPFVILSGLSGSGKTQLATAFARWISVKDEQVLVMPVGADWTNREFLLGYTNALDPNKYETTKVIKLIQEAVKDSDNPYFLILDEMNLSYVERYFADFLSAMESGEPIHLWEKPAKSDDSTPNEFKQLPQNLFIIGTINVDETTYMFSPKVLDRANVIEFRIMREDMDRFFEGFKPIVKAALDANHDDGYGKLFVKIAKNIVQADEKVKEDAVATLSLFFDELKKVHAEFGYRTAAEMFRFMTLYKHFNSGANYDPIVDAAIVQKLLPKLHGSRKKIVDVLNRLWNLCLKNANENNGLEKIKEFKKEECKYPLSAEKIFRMYNIALDNGYTSFAEA